MIKLKIFRPFKGRLVGFALFDHLAERRGFGLQQRRFRSHFYDLADLADLKLGNDMGILLNLDNDIGADKVLEPLLFHVNFVLAGEQVHKREKPVAAAGLRALFRRAQVGQRHFGIRDDSPRSIGDRSGDRTISALAVERDRSSDKQDERGEQHEEFATRHK